MMESLHAKTDGPPSLFRLFASFLRLGVSAFGGPAMVAYIRKMAVEQRKWLDEATFQGLRAMTVAIVANAALSFGKRSVKRPADIIIAALAAAMFALKMNPIVVILSAALMGLGLYRKPITSRPEARAETRNEVHRGWRVTPLFAIAAAAFVLLFLADRGLFDLGALMLRIDLFAFGGGFASVPLMYHEIVDVHSWMDSETFMNGIALGQVTPGPIVITATFVGYWLRGIAGAILATVSVFLPSFLMVVAITPWFDRLRASDHFNRCMSGILASFVGLLISVTIQFGLNVPWDVPKAVIGGGALLTLLLGVDVLWVVLAGIAVSILVL